MDNITHSFIIVRGVLSNYSGCGGKVVVPSGVVRTEDHCSFGNLVFCENETITEIVFPEGLEEIGSEACYGCTNLVSVKLPSTLKRIGDRAFTHCVKLDHVEIPKGVRSIGAGAFEDTMWLNSASDEPFYIGSELYKYNGRAPESGIVAIRPGTTRIGDYAFSGVKGMTGVEIPPSCLRIGLRAFEHCSDLRSVVIPETVMWIGGGLFTACSSLEGAVIPNCHIEDVPWIFEFCPNLKRITIPESFGGIYERLLPNLEEVRITGTEFSKRDRNWFVDSSRTSIISTLPLSKFPKEAKLAAILSFAKRYMDNEEMPTSYVKESLRYLRQQRKRLMETAREHPDLRSLMLAENMLTEEELGS